MTELEKKQSGEFYDTRDAQIRTAHNRAKELMKRYNDIPASEAEEREMLLRMADGPCLFTCTDPGRATGSGAPGRR